MISWGTRSAEERTLLNPGFCGALLWQSAGGYAKESGILLPFDLSFLVLPIVLHRESREMLPHSISTSLAVWLDENPLTRSRIAERARMLAPFTKDALMFAGTHGLIAISDLSVSANADWKKKVDGILKDSSDEVRACSRRAEFIGRWFAKAGSPGTVMALIGVRA